MVLFGVPEAIEDAPRAAVNAAIEMRRRLREYNRKHDLSMPLEVHSGINTGLGIAGDISGPLIREFAVMGDSVEVADQLTDLAPPGAIYVGPETRRFTRDVFEYRALDPLPLRGGDAHFEPYELLSTEPRRYRARIGAERQVFSDFVGRDKELALLRERLDRLCAGEGGIASLVAEAGTGKSRLAAELAASDPAKAVRWLEGRSLSTGQQLSFHPFADLCRSWAGISDEDGEESARAKLEDAIARVLGDEADEVFPFIAQIMGMRVTGHHAERLSRIQGDALEKMVRNGVTHLLRAASRRKPIVIVMDDLHWADLSSIELFESLLRLIEDHPIFFLNMTRPGFGETAGRIRAFAHENHAARNLEIELAPLAPQAARQLISNLFKLGDIPHATRALIEEKARGNPFFIEEVVRSLVDEGAVVYRDGSFRATEKIHSVVIPGTIQEVIMARVDGLDLGKRRLLQVASVVGRSFHHEVLTAIVADSDQLEGDLTALTNGEFIVPWDRLQGVEYGFKHPLIQEVIYDGLLQSRRQDLHLEVARAIEARLSEDVPGYLGMLAYHFSKGGDVERTEEFLFRAGDEAARVAASSEALQFFREALALYLELHGKDADPNKQELLQKNIARALFNRGQLIDAEEHFNRALECLGERVPRGERALLLSFVRDLAAVLTSLYLPGGRRAKPPATPTQSEVIELMFERGQCAITANPERFVFDAMALVRRLMRVDPRTVSGSGMMFGACSGIFSYGAGAFGVSRRFLALAQPLVREDDPQAYFHYRTANLVHHIYEGDWSPEHEVKESLVHESLQYGQLWDVITYLANHGDQKIAMGQFQTARAEIELAAKIRDQYENDLARSTHGYLSTLLALEERRLEDALREAEVYYQENAEELLHVHALSGKAKAQVLLGDLSGAAQTLSLCSGVVQKLGARRIPPFQLSNYQRSRLLLDVAELEAAREAGDEARARGARRRGRSSGREALRLAHKCVLRKTEVLRLLGRYHWLAGNEAQARRWWRRSLAEGRQLGARPETARACLAVARYLGERGGPDASLDGRTAADYLQEARATFEELDLRWDLQQLEAIGDAVS
jgi:tetratricopeptide (TPR) repeat protein